MHETSEFQFPEDSGRRVETYESALRAGGDPRLEDHLPADGSDRLSHLLELLQVDLELRLRRGEAVSAAGYLARFPELASLGSRVLPLIHVEVHCREKLGQKVDLEALVAPFPALGEQIGQLLRQRGTLPPEIPGFSGLEILGRGGMGVVYRAREARLNRVVALKVIRPDRVTDPDHAEQFRQRFQVEAEKMAAVSHPHVVQVYQAGQAGGEIYLAMEYVQGESLQGKINREGKLAFREAAELVEQLALGVAAVHVTGTIHRDLKPDNVLVSEKGVPKVTDFGLAREIERTDGATVEGVFRGTPEYASPEQAAMGSQDLTERTDVYGLGGILYACLTGRPPFVSDSLMALLRKVMHDPVSPVKALRPDCPKDLETICLKCMEKDPGRRYQSAVELAEDLRRYQEGRPILARPVGALEKGWLWAKRNKALAGALASTLAILLVSAIGFGGLSWWAIQEKDKANFNALKAENNLKSAERRETLAVEAIKRFANVIDGTEELKNNPSLEKLRLRLLEEPKDLYESLICELENTESSDKSSFARMRSFLDSLGTIHYDLGRKELAMHAWERAKEIGLALGLSEDEESIHIHTALSLVKNQLKEYPEALEEGKEALRIALKHQADKRQIRSAKFLVIGLLRDFVFRGDASRLSELEEKIQDFEKEIKDLADSDQSPDDWTGLALHLSNLAALYLDYPDVEYARSAVDFLEKVIGQLEKADSPGKELLSLLGTLRQNFAIVLERVGEKGKALKEFVKANKVLEERYSREKCNQQIQNSLAGNLADLANKHLDIGDFNKAIGFATRALDLYQDQLKRNPDLVRAKENLGGCWLTLAKAQTALAHAPQAKEAFDKAIESYARVREAYLMEFLGAKTLYGHFLIENGEPDAARKIVGEVVDALLPKIAGRRQYEVLSEATIGVLADLANFMQSVGDLPKAAEIIALAEKGLEENSKCGDRIRDAVEQISLEIRLMAAMVAGKPEETVVLVQNNLARLQSRKQKTDLPAQFETERVAKMLLLSAMARLGIGAGEWDKALLDVDEAEKSLSAIKENHRSDSVKIQLIRCHGIRALCHAKKGEISKAEKEADIVFSALKASEPTMRANEIRRLLVNTLGGISFIMSISGKMDKATGLMERAKKTAADFLQFNSDDSEMLNLYARTSNDLGTYYKDKAQSRDGKKEYLEKAAENFKISMEIKSRILKKRPEDPGAHSDLGGSLSNFSQLEKNLEKRLDMLEKAIFHQKKALEANPNHVIYRDFMGKHLGLYVSGLIQEGGLKQMNYFKTIFKLIGEIKARKYRIAYLAEMRRDLFAKLIMELSSMGEKDEKQGKASQELLEFLESPGILTEPDIGERMFLGTISWFAQDHKKTISIFENLLALKEIGNDQRLYAMEILIGACQLDGDQTRSLELMLQKVDLAIKIYQSDKNQKDQAHESLRNLSNYYCEIEQTELKRKVDRQILEIGSTKLDK
jgi:tetratricopeptide (TPR) repeat protein